MLPLRLLAKGEATPGAIVSVPPWTDLTLQNASVDENEDNDKMLSRNTLELFRASWLQEPKVDLAAPEISLVNADLAVHPLPEGQHSFILGAGRVPEVDQTIQQMGQWLRRHLGT